MRPRLDSIYAYDPVIITGRGAILCRMGKEQRRAESAVTGAFLERTRDSRSSGASNHRGRSKRVTSSGSTSETLAVGQGYRTNDEGIRQFREILDASVTS